ncbi:hypothetical protein U9M48_023455, partial [Paspalum notatum var. saurae]
HCISLHSRALSWHTYRSRERRADASHWSRSPRTRSRTRSRRISSRPPTPLPTTLTLARKVWSSSSRPCWRGSLLSSGVTMSWHGGDIGGRDVTHLLSFGLSMTYGLRLPP